MNRKIATSLIRSVDADDVFWEFGDGRLALVGGVTNGGEIRIGCTELCVGSDARGGGPRCARRRKRSQTRPAQRRRDYSSLIEILIRIVQMTGRSDISRLGQDIHFLQCLVNFVSFGPDLLFLDGRDESYWKLR